jgi:hypothetical protein
MRALLHKEALQEPASLVPVIPDDCEPDKDAIELPRAQAATPDPAPCRRRRLPQAAVASPVPSDWLTAEQLAQQLHLITGAVQRRAQESLIPAEQMLHHRGRWWFEPEVEPPKPQPREPRPAPEGWMHGAAVCTLLGIERAQLARRCREGVLSDGTYQPHGPGYRFDGELGKGAENAATNSGTITLRAMRHGSFSSV